MNIHGIIFANILAALPLLVGCENPAMTAFDPLGLFGSKDGASSSGAIGTALYDSGSHHLGDEYRTDFEHHTPEGTSKSYSFQCSATPSGGALNLSLRNVDAIGANVSINGSNVASFHNTSGNQSIQIAPGILRAGQNSLTISAGKSGGQIEDFEYSGLGVSVIY